MVSHLVLSTTLPPVAEHVLRPSDMTLISQTIVELPFTMMDRVEEITVTFVHAPFEKLLSVKVVVALVQSGVTGLPPEVKLPSGPHE